MMRLPSGAGEYRFAHPTRQFSKTGGAEMATDTEGAEAQAKAQLEGIMAMVARLEHAGSCDNPDCGLDDASILTGIGLVGDKADNEEREQYHDEDDAQQAINEDPLSVEIRSGWHVAGQESDGGEYKIVLCTGGPAVRIVGDLSCYNEPESAQLQYQDWFTPWMDCAMSDAEERAVLTYAQTFYFG